MLVARSLIVSLIFYSVSALVPAHASSERIRQEIQRLQNLSIDIPTAVAKIQQGTPLKLGMHGERVVQLRERLRQLGWPLSEHHNDIFDEAIDHAVREFQQQQGIGADGLVDRQTIFNLNLSRQDRLGILRRQLSEMENFERQVSGRYIVVNIPAYTLTAYEGKKAVLHSKVIVGRPERPTPVMKSDLVGVQFNPPWYVPPTVIKNDLVRNNKVDVKYLVSHQLAVLDREGNAVPVQALANASDLNGYRFYQPPGDKNALGQLKFQLDNTQSIYLHDTQQRHLFHRENRAYSSGCVRVDSYRQLAAWVLNTSHHEIDHAIERKKTVVRKVEQAVPVYFVYWLAHPSQEHVTFFYDVYQLGRVRTNPAKPS